MKNRIKKDPLAEVYKTELKITAQRCIRCDSISFQNDKCLTCGLPINTGDNFIKNMQLFTKK